MYETDNKKPNLAKLLAYVLLYTQGLWRAKRGDHVENEFFMVLMDRGMYDGGFNIRMAVNGASQPSVSE